MPPGLARGLAVVGIVTAVVAAPTEALAVAAHHHPHPHAKPKASVHGLVVSAHGRKLVVLAQTAVVGRRTVHNRVETVVLAAHHGRASAPRVEQGDEVAATGVVSGAVITDGTVQSSTPQPAEVVFGTVSAVNGSLITLAARDKADGREGGPTGGDQNGGDQNGGDQNGGDQNGGDQNGGDQNGGDQNGGDQNGGDHNGEAVIVDSAAATFSGPESGASSLTSGEYVVALGEQAGQDFVAADVVTYNSAPAFVIGHVLSADQSTNTLTVAAQDGDNNEDSNVTGTPVDTTNALVVVNGAQNGSYPAVGDRVLALGPDGSAGVSQSGTPLAATLVFAFNEEDHSPADG